MPVQILVDQINGNRPFYRVMVADGRSPRDGKHLEVLGYYNPLPGQDGGKRMGLKFDRVKYWLSVGAQPSEPVQRLLFRTGLLPPPPMLAMGCKGGPRDTRPIDPMTGRYLTHNEPATDSSKECEGDRDGDEDSGSAHTVEKLFHVAFDCGISQDFPGDEAACAGPANA